MSKKKTIEQILKEVDETIKKRINKIFAGLTQEQRLAMIENPDLVNQILADIDPDKIATYYNISLVETAGTIIKSYAKELTELQKNKVSFFVDGLVKLKTESLKNFVTSNKETFKNKIIELAINGSREDAVNEYFKRIPFTTSQIGTLLNTTEADIRRTTITSAYEDDKEQRFRYVGGLIPTSSDICTWLIQNQDENGYTMEEIQNGIETPFGNVDAGGRIPNYNCIHHWEPIIV